VGRLGAGANAPARIHLSSGRVRQLTAPPDFVNSPTGAQQTSNPCSSSSLASRGGQCDITTVVPTTIALAQKLIASSGLSSSGSGTRSAMRRLPAASSAWGATRA
jgi:hypothetical protein